MGYIRPTIPIHNDASLSFRLSSINPHHFNFPHSSLAFPLQPPHTPLIEAPTLVEISPVEYPSPFSPSPPDWIAPVGQRLISRAGASCPCSLGATPLISSLLPTQLCAAYSGPPSPILRSLALTETCSAISLLDSVRSLHLPAYYPRLPRLILPF